MRVHDDGSGVAHYRFRVDEAFFGVKSAEIEVYSGRGDGDCSYHFRSGERYLVVPFANQEKLFATLCSETRRYRPEDPLISLLRAVRDHKPVASVYGTLEKAIDPFGACLAEPLSGIKIGFADASGPRKFESITDSSGVYQIQGLPAGKYKVTADLPPELMLFGNVPPVSTLEFPAGACYVLPLQAMPAAKIRGRILNEKGQAIYGGVELLRGSSYVAGSHGQWESSGKDGFKFEMVPDGPYVLVFNKDNEPNPDSPYPRTFYPGVTDPDKLVPIIVEGGKAVTADIHVSGATPVHRLDVSVTWPDSSPVQGLVFVFAEPGNGRGSGSDEIGPGLFRLNLFHGQRYTIKASLYCGERCINDGCRGYGIEAPPTDFDVPASPSSALHIAFTESACPK